MRFLILFWGLIFSISAPLLAQTDSTGMFKASVSELMKLPVKEMKNTVSVAGFQESTLQNSPSIVTLITEDEIRNSGSQDLTEILRTVAGLEFTQNFDAVLGLGVRGNWAEEGKYLFAIDGLIINETGFGTLSWGMRFPVSHISRIEIIRGAGSAIYGGLAALAVINVISKSPAEKGETCVLAYGGVAEGRFSKAGLEFQSHQKLKNNAHLSLMGNISEGNRSNFLDKTTNGNQYNYADSSGVKNINLNIGLSFKELKIRFLYNNYRFQSIANQLEGSMQDWLLGVSHTFSLSPKFTLQPRFQWKRHLPWRYADYQALPFRASYDGYKTTNNRYTASLIGLFKPSENLFFTLGTEFYLDQAHYDAAGFLFYNQQKNIYFQNVAVFSEIALNSKFANLTVGARFEKNSAYSAAFVPRLALTKAWEKLHYKFLANWAFKAPTIQNIQYARENQIDPENIFSLEMEVGYHFTPTLSLTCNAFNIQINKPIVYFYNAQTLEEYYTNSLRTGSQGIEGELNWKHKKGFLRANYSFYRPQSDNSVEEYKVEERSNTYRALPNHKFTLRGSYDLTEKLTLGTSFLYLGERFSYLFYNTDFDEVKLTRFEPNALWNVSLEYKKLFKRNLSLALRLNNLLNQKSYQPSPNNPTSYPLLVQAQEMVLALRYSLD